MNYFLALMAALFCASCNIRPLVTTTAAGTNVAWLGGSLLSSSDSENAAITRPDGTTLSYSRINGNETVVANNYLKAGVLKKAIGTTGSVLNTGTKAAAGAKTSGGQAAPAVAGAVVGAGAATMLANPVTGAPIPLPVMQARKPEDIPQ